MLKLGLLAAALALAASPAFADYKEEYKAYKSALAAGDRTAARDRAEAAWRAAETEIGPVATTAILAYNFAIEVSYSDPARSLEAFDRAIEIEQQSGNLGSIPLDVALLRRAEARLRSDFENKLFAKELEEKLAGVASSDDPIIEAQALGWRSVAVFNIRAKKFDRAKSAADTAISFGERISPPSPSLLREIFFIAGLSRVTGSVRTEEDVYEAVILFDRAAGLFPPQPDIDHFDPLLAQTIAWGESVGALAESYGSKPNRPTGSKLLVGEDLGKAYERAMAKRTIDEFKWKSPKPAACDSGLSWIERKPPTYPRTALIRGSIGAILIGYEVDGVGVSRTVVLTDFTEAGFGEAALKSMSDWRLEPGSDPACWKNNITIFKFIIS